MLGATLAISLLTGVVLGLIAALWNPENLLTMEILLPETGHPEP